MAVSRTVWTAGLVLALGCSWLRPGTRPDDMSAQAHRREAEEHARWEAEHQRAYHPEARSRAGASPEFGPHPQRSRFGYRYSDLYWDVREYNPTQVHRDRAKRHSDLAREHAKAARALEEFEESECQAFPRETRVVCPLVAQVESMQDVFGGVRVHLAEGVNVNAAMTHLRCHQAFARARGREGMDSCPLYMPGVWVERFRSSREVDLLALDPDDVDELRRRAREHLGMGATE
jgi:hypothetical protein